MSSIRHLAIQKTPSSREHEHGVPQVPHLGPGKARISQIEVSKRRERGALAPTNVGTTQGRPSGPGRSLVSTKMCAPCLDSETWESEILARRVFVLLNHCHLRTLAQPHYGACWARGTDRDNTARRYISIQLHGLLGNLAIRFSAARRQPQRDQQLRQPNLIRLRSRRHQQTRPATSSRSSAVSFC